MNYAPLIRLPYNDLSGVIAVWAGACESMAAYEHEADKTVTSTHVHIIMLNCKYKTAEPLKRLYYKMFPAANTADGNGLWSWVNKDEPNPNIEFIRYMSKGVLRPKFVKNISPAKVEELRESWSEPSPQLPTQPSLHESAKESKLTKHGIISRVVNLILAEDNEKTEVQRKEKLINIEDRIVLRVIRKVLIQENQVLGLYKVMDLYDAFVMYHQKEKFLSNCLHILEKRSR